MNYANMIQEEKLKKTFIIATLVSTLVGTFASSHALYERLRDQKRQQTKDSAQDAKIKELEAQLKKKNDKKDSGDRDEKPMRDELLDYLATSGTLIRREYNNGYSRLGNRFAGGDLVAENQLQAQIISLQQTVIHVLQEALYNNRQLSRSDMERILAASLSARDGSLDALRQQHQRLLLHAPERSLSLPPKPRLQLEAAPPQSPTSSITGRIKPYERIKMSPMYCPYSIDLQLRPRRPLVSSFDANRDSHCPECRLQIDVNSEDMWRIAKHIPILVKANRSRTEDVFEQRTFCVDPRFVVKCHTETGHFACLLCHLSRGVDILYTNPESLVGHVGREHEAEEYEREVDIVEIRQ